MTKIRTTLTGFIFLALTVLNASVSAQEIDTTIDREEVIRGETITLTVRISGQQSGLTMDLSPLRENFEIITTRTASQMRSVNNRVQSWTEYIITLFPLQLGEQEIPGFQVGSETTPAFAINVQEAPQGGLNGEQSLYLETSISSDSVYVQEQLLFTIRLYFTISGIRNPNFTELDFDNAVVQMIGSPNQYEQLVNGVRYGVYEKNYVIFPQRSGEIAIPDIVFRGEQTDGSSNFVFRYNSGVRAITAFSEGHRINVRERPAAYPQGRTWLPSTDVSIREDWSQDITRLQPGDTVDRTITLTGFGLDGAALPPLERPRPDRFNIYPGRVDIDRTFIDGNIVGSRVERYSMVATEAGSVIIPEVRVPWWDTETEELRYAVLPESFITVSAAASTAQADDEDGAGTEPGSLLQRDFADDDLLSRPTTPGWILTLVVLTAAALLLLYYRMVHRPAAAAAAVRQQQSAEEDESVDAAELSAQQASAYQRDIAAAEEKAAFRELEKSCRNDNTQLLRMALIGWGRQFYQDSSLHNLDDLAARTGSEEIIGSCQRLQASLYAQDSERSAFDQPAREELLASIAALRTETLREQNIQNKRQSYELPPLYRS